MISDCMLEVLGDYFVEKQLQKKGWEFHEFVEAWQSGYIEFTKNNH